MPDRLDRYQGCLVGLACGDALGAPVEFHKRDELDANPITEMIGGGHFNWAPGQVTDDTNMMLCIAESLVENEGLDLPDITRRFITWMETDPPDIGNQTRDALILSKQKWIYDAGVVLRERYPLGAGNGSVMRTAPVGLFFKDEAERGRTAAEISCITHGDSFAIAGCQLISHLVASLVTGQELNEIFKRSWFSLARGDGFDVRDLPRDQIRSYGYALHTVQAAIWSLVHSSSFEEAVITAVNLGEDTDTVGAVTGALAGAHWGFSSIPDRWTTTLRLGKEPDHLSLDLRNLANCLNGMAT